MPLNGAHIVVIGGGFAGVAAAAALRAGGAAVTVLDDHRTLGGRARSDAWAGFTVDTGAQLIATSFARTLRLLTPEGASSAPLLHRVAGRDAYVRDGERYALQFGSIRSLLAFGALTPMEKLKLARHLAPTLAMHRAALDASAWHIPPALDRESARAFMDARIGEHAADVLVEPPLNGFYAATGGDVSFAFYLMLGRYGSDGDVLAPTAGWSAALEGALRGAACECEARVRALEPRGDGITVYTDDGRSWSADGAIVATGPRSAHALLAPHLGADHALARWLAALTLRPTWTLALALDRAARRDAFGVFRDARSAQLVSACAVHGASIPDPPPDRDVILAWPTPRAIHQLAGSPSPRIASAMLPEIEALVPEVQGHVVRARVYRFDEGTPLASPGFAADRARGRALAEGISALPVALAGDYLTAPMIEGAVASGERAAELLAHRLSPGAHPLDS